MLPGGAPRALLCPVLDGPHAQGAFLAHRRGPVVELAKRALGAGLGAGRLVACGSAAVAVHASREIRFGHLSGKAGSAEQPGAVTGDRILWGPCDVAVFADTFEGGEPGLLHVVLYHVSVGAGATVALPGAVLESEPRAGGARQAVLALGSCGAGLAVLIVAAMAAPGPRAIPGLTWKALVAVGGTIARTTGHALLGSGLFVLCQVQAYAAAGRYAVRRQPLSGSAGGFAVWAPLAAGGSTVVVRPGVHGDGEGSDPAFPGWLCRSAIVLWVVIVVMAYVSWVAGNFSPDIVLSFDFVGIAVDLGFETRGGLLGCEAPARIHIPPRTICHADSGRGVHMMATIKGACVHHFSHHHHRVFGWAGAAVRRLIVGDSLRDLVAGALLALVTGGWVPVLPVAVGTVRCGRTGGGLARVDRIDFRQTTLRGASIHAKRRGALGAARERSHATSDA